MVLEPELETGGIYANNHSIKTPISMSAVTSAITGYFTDLFQICHASFECFWETVCVCEGNGITNSGERTEKKVCVCVCVLAGMTAAHSSSMLEETECLLAVDSRNKSLSLRLATYSLLRSAWQSLLPSVPSVYSFILSLLLLRFLSTPHTLSPSLTITIPTDGCRNSRERMNCGTW